MSNPMFNRPTVGPEYGGLKQRALCVHNYPDGMEEEDLYSFFPSAASIVCQPNSSSPSCLIQFHSDADCQAAFIECQNGKLVGGQSVQAQIILPSGSDRNFSGGGAGIYSTTDRPRTGRGDCSGGTVPTPLRGCDVNYLPEGSSFTLTLRNLAWSVTEDDLIREFPRAINALIKLDERNRSRGWGTVTFANHTDCQNAEAECSRKSINGRPVRAEIGNSERFRDDRHRGGRAGGRPFYDRHDRGGRRGGAGYGGDGVLSRRYNEVDGSERRPYGGGLGRGGFGGQRRGFDRDRRDRSPTRRRTPCGAGARITSAVIRRTPGDSSDSDFDNRD